MKKVMIIGAGISGLVAGIYARQSGFDVTIYESHSIPGGASTSWRRKGYLFEGGLHWLTGSSPKTALYGLWRNVGALDDTVRVHNRDPFFAFEHDGKTAYLYRDIGRLCKHFTELSPEDEREIRRLCVDIRKFTKVDMPITDIKGVKVAQKAKIPLGKLISMLPAFARMSFYANQTTKEYAERFQSPLLRQFLQSIVGPDNAATGMAFTMSTLASGDGGYPEGGSLGMARRIAEKFVSLGGSIVYNTPVEKVLVRNGVARGIVVSGKEIAADAVIVTQDTLTAVDRLFNPPLSEPWIEKLKAQTTPMLCTFVCLGVEADLSDLPKSLSFVSKHPVICGGIPESVIGFNNYAGYRGYAPEGCTAVTAAFLGDSYDFWKACKESGTYEDEKQKLAESFTQILEEKYPQIKEKVAVWDVATPLTYERYLGSFKGSWMSTMPKGSKMESFPVQSESIKNLYFAGQRLTPPGGLPPAAETGRKSVQHLCRDTNTIFEN